MKGRAVVEPGEGARAAERGEGARAAERGEKAPAADRGEGDGPTAAADPRKSVTVPVAAAEAFRIYTECPAEWLPAEHTFIPNPQSITVEPRAGGRFYERGAGGAEITRGTSEERAAPRGPRPPGPRSWSGRRRTGWGAAGGWARAGGPSSTTSTPASSWSSSSR